MANQISQEQVQSKKELKKRKQGEKREKQARTEEKSSKRRVRIRLIPIWLRLILLIVFLAASLASGLMIGYGVIGDGKPKDVFKEKTWTHIIDLVIKDK
ncbi:DNA-directed RNA polymerase subunit beta [Lederbergia sp. NSJ-179]|uniref:DNA-directed RNA polymerase subunit beta n=1 Tax=Lederbergia sp. NSJ-179 TaxID=2931402 RepID=UPI001FD1CEA5|nr:DNA-directed RNA polymerase subunit beta [Lederbergia sp. NSJ-179]MCJ7840588.1 DNA-directed RNA polymerase subunit beta [Lederbergia sp. NSJ-179]